jgi:O-antigen/teichoic acid export membrane protein
MVIRKFLANVSYLVILNLLVKATWIFGIDRTVQVVVGEQAYGLYFAVFNLTLIFQILMDMGIQTYNNIQVSGDRNSLMKWFPHVLGFKFWFTFLYFGALLGCGYLIGWRETEFQLLIPVGVNIWLLTFILYFRSSLTAMHRFRADAWISVLDRLLVIILAGSVLLFEPFGIQMTIKHFVFIQTIGLAISALISGILVLRGQQGIKINLSVGPILQLLKNSFPFALSVILMGAYSRIDSVMLERLLPNGASQAGIYAAGYRILDMSNMLGFMFATILLPLFASAKIHGTDRSKLYHTGLKIMMTLSLSLTVFCLASADGLIAFLYPHSEIEWAMVFRYLIIGFIPYSIIYVSSTYLIAKGDINRLNNFFFLGFAANLLLNLILIPEHGALGAALATLATQSIVALLILWRSEWGRSVGKPAKDAILGFILIVILLVIALSLYRVDINWLLRGITGGIMSLILIRISGFLTEKELIALWKQRSNKEEASTPNT